MAPRSGPATLVLVTCANQEQGVSIARALVSERLAACVNVVERIRSIYRWRDKIADDRETLLLVKTRIALLPRVERRVRELHSYDVPEIVSLRFDQVSKPYLKWLLDSTERGRRRAVKQ